MLSDIYPVKTHIQHQSKVDQTDKLISNSGQASSGTAPSNRGQESGVPALSNEGQPLPLPQAAQLTDAVVIAGSDQGSGQ